MTPRCPQADDSGFTLLETLVALVVMGFLMAGLAQGVQFGLQAWGTQSRQIAIGVDMDSVDRALRRLIEQADPGDPAQDSPLLGAAHTLSFLTRLPLGASPGPTREVKVGLGVDGRHRLVMRAVEQPHAELLGPAPVATETVLLDQVDHIDFSYWQGGAKGRWGTSWTDATLPGLVRIGIAFRHGDKRHWPDLLAAPERARSDQ